MASGGKRSGAGRRPTITPQETYEIVSHCERLLIRFVPEIDPCRPYAVALAEVEAIEVDERASWLRTEGAEERLDDIEFALREEQKIADVGQAASRLKVYKRPYGKDVRQKIAAEVASHWSEKLGRPISSETVFRYWKAHRAGLRRPIDLIVTQF